MCRFVYVLLNQHTHIHEKQIVFSLFLIDPKEDSISTLNCQSDSPMLSFGCHCAAMVVSALKAE